MFAGITPHTSLKDKDGGTDLLVLKLIAWSLSMLKRIGESPMQYFLSIVMPVWRQRRDGLFSWNKSPPSRMKSTYRKKNKNNTAACEQDR